jgi:lysophospholipase L1-like esterase
MSKGMFLQLSAAALGMAQDPAATRDWTTADDHRHMLGQLGIRSLRPGPSGNESAPNHANYDESLANPFPDYPPILRLRSGAVVGTPEAWWRLRRPEIVEDFEREVYGRVPKNAPRVTWRVTSQGNDRVGPFPVIAREVAGVAENPDFPGVQVTIQMVVVTPAWIQRPVPLMILFGRAALPSAPVPAAFARFAALSGPDPPSTVQLIGTGWGYAMLNPNSAQADNGAGLTKGVIGLSNRGQPRRPDDWGALRAWAWSASRALDFLETLPAVDARRVGIEGVSRYGKAALAAMAFDSRFAVALVASSGEGGVKPHRRNFGEAVENLTGAGQYHWMAGNFLKYGAAEASFGSRNAGDLPVDAHQLIALCAPRPVFVSYGVPEKGDARWLDQQGSFMATVAAGEAYRLLGAKDLGIEEDYRKVRLPPVHTSLLDGQLAWRQHDGGHTDGPNWKYFLPWANRELRYQPPGAPPFPARVAVPRLDANSLLAHGQLREKAAQGGISIYFVGDSITRRWGATDYPRLLAHWKRSFHGWHAANFGWGGDQTQNILWRLQNGELENVRPRVVVVQAGANNLPLADHSNPAEAAQDITTGIQEILATIREKAPAAAVVLTGIFPRHDRPGLFPLICEINRRLAGLAAREDVRFLDLTTQLADGQGRLRPGFSTDGLHLEEPGYEVWASALRPIFQEILGPPESVDHAPPPTGDPSARR